MKLSVEEMLEKFSNNSTHPQEVRKIALMIFDEVAAKLCEFTDRNRRVLEAAALLHDIGYYVDTKHHNKHSQEMVLQHGLKGFDGR
ncbi:HD domain-containing protein, partial [bacterium]|nr:HD domain-containing protein [bacterium]